jgi:hypothetical protein
MTADYLNASTAEEGRELKGKVEEGNNEKRRFYGET